MGRRRNPHRHFSPLWLCTLHLSTASPFPSCSSPPQACSAAEPLGQGSLSSEMTPTSAHLPDPPRVSLPVRKIWQGTGFRISLLLLPLQRLKAWLLHCWLVASMGNSDAWQRGSCSPCSAELLTPHNKESEDIFWCLIADSFSASLLSVLCLTPCPADERPGRWLLRCQREIQRTQTLLCVRQPSSQPRLLTTVKPLSLLFPS